MDELLGHFFTYRIAVGPQLERKAFTLRTLPASDPESRLSGTLGQVAGLSLHAGVVAGGGEHGKLQSLSNKFAAVCRSCRH